MALAGGARLGPYEIVGALGAGGMGEVYRARDTRLERTVAIKILPQGLAADPQFRERFDREARTISSLDHPHICALYDVGEQDGTAFLVMQYLEGETLELRLQRGALPLDNALTIAIQIASALDKAHRAGIVHRDLKPGNIMLTKAGAKLLDFGLAKQSVGRALLGPPEPAVAVAGPQGPAYVPTSLPTTPPNLTAQGTILGTFQYMAPEQLEGREADARTDIFAFGAVLYEMLTGKKAFEGKSQASLIGAILKDAPPPISAAQSMAAPALDRVVQTCLAKDPDDRWQTARDLLRELKWIVEGRTEHTKTSPGARPASRTRAVGLVVVTALVAVSATIALFRANRNDPIELAPVRFTVMPPPGTTLADRQPNLTGLAVAPDGQRLAFTVFTGGQSVLAIRELDAQDAHTLPGAVAAGAPFWSPDSRFVGFFSNGKLRTVNVASGLVQTICDASPVLGTGSGSQAGTWNAEGVIVFATSHGLARVAASGGQPAPLKGSDASKVKLNPQFLPDGRHVLAVAYPDRVVEILSLDTGETKRLGNSDSQAIFVAPGFLLLVRQGRLLAQRFSLDRLEAIGDPVEVADAIEVGAGGNSTFSVSDAGVLAYRTEDLESEQLVWYDRAGKRGNTIGERAALRQIALSPDGTRVAASRRTTGTTTYDLWLFDVVRGVSSRFTTDPVNNEDNPVWSPDSQRIAFNCGLDLCEKALAGGDARVLLTTQEQKIPEDWSKDGRFLTYESPNNGFGLWILPLAGDRQPFAFLKDPFPKNEPHFSPDGRWMLYMSDESGRSEIYLQPFQTPGERIRISDGGGGLPRWRQDGKELFYLSLDGQLMAVGVKLGPAPELGIPKVLFQTPIRSVQATIDHYDVSPDGQRFVVISPATDAAPLTVIVNWQEELKK